MDIVKLPKYKKCFLTPSITSPKVEFNPKRLSMGAELLKALGESVDNYDLSAINAYGEAAEIFLKTMGVKNI